MNSFMCFFLTFDELWCYDVHKQFYSHHCSHCNQHLHHITSQYQHTLHHPNSETDPSNNAIKFHLSSFKILTVHSVSWFLVSFKILHPLLEFGHAEATVLVSSISSFAHWNSSLPSVQSLFPSQTHLPN